MLQFLGIFCLLFCACLLVRFHSNKGNPTTHKQSKVNAETQRKGKCNTIKPAQHHQREEKFDLVKVEKPMMSMSRGLAQDFRLQFIGAQQREERSLGIPSCVWYHACKPGPTSSCRPEANTHTYISNNVVLQ